MASVSTQQQQRAKFVMSCLEQIKPEQAKEALKEIGSNDRHLKRKVINCLKDHYSIYPPRKRCRPLKYSPELLQAAYNLLADPGDVLYTGPKLKERLTQDHLVDFPICTDTLLQHLKTFCASKGHRLLTTFTGTIFLVSPASQRRRLQWCRETQAKLVEDPVDSWIFEDETEIEEHPHPKGRW
jgi:hypothetical protein